MEGQLLSLFPLENVSSSAVPCSVCCQGHLTRRAALGQYPELDLILGATTGMLLCHSLHDSCSGGAASTGQDVAPTPVSHVSMCYRKTCRGTDVLLGTAAGRALEELA